jgi:hypothetical protein
VVAWADTEATVVEWVSNVFVCLSSYWFFVLHEWIITSLHLQYGGYGGGVSSQRVRYKPVQDRVLYLCFTLLIFLLTSMCFHLLLQYGGYGRGGYGGEYI